MRIPSALRRWLKRHLIQIRQDVRIAPGADVGLDVHFEGMNAVYAGSVVGASEIGRGTYIAARSTIKRARIGRFCSIGAEVRISLGLHPASEFVSSHPAFFSPTAQAGFSFVDHSRFEEHARVDGRHSVVIGHDVWIGDRAMIMDGVTIGNGAVIGAGALVTRAVDPYSIVVGIPAKSLRKRFDDETISLLAKSAWWDRTPEWLRQHADDFGNPMRFLDLLKSERGVAQ
jgi:acetyltransferase-like isoleucine patch superfamily enzyme